MQLKKQQKEGIAAVAVLQKSLQKNFTYQCIRKYITIFGYMFFVFFCFFFLSKKMQVSIPADEARQMHMVLGQALGETPDTNRYEKIRALTQFQARLAETCHARRDYIESVNTLIVNAMNLLKNIHICMYDMHLLQDHEQELYELTGRIEKLIQKPITCKEVHDELSDIFKAIVTFARSIPGLSESAQCHTVDEVTREVMPSWNMLEDFNDETMAFHEAYRVLHNGYIVNAYLVGSPLASKLFTVIQAMFFTVSGAGCGGNRQFAIQAILMAIGKMNFPYATISLMVKDIVDWFCRTDQLYVKAADLDAYAKQVESLVTSTGKRYDKLNKEYEQRNAPHEDEPHVEEGVFDAIIDKTELATRKVIPKAMQDFVMDEENQPLVKFIIPALAMGKFEAIKEIRGVLNYIQRMAYYHAIGGKKPAMSAFMTKIVNRDLKGAASKVVGFNPVGLAIGGAVLLSSHKQEVKDVANEFGRRVQSYETGETEYPFID